MRSAYACARHAGIALQRHPERALLVPLTQPAPAYTEDRLLERQAQVEGLIMLSDRTVEGACRSTLQCLGHSALAWMPARRASECCLFGSAAHAVLCHAMPGSEAAARVTTEALASDMAAFKAANPGAELEVGAWELGGSCLWTRLSAPRPPACLASLACCLHSRAGLPALALTKGPGSRREGMWCWAKAVE